MRTASITETKNRLSALIDEVKRGETVLILDRGRPVARLVRAAADPVASDGRVERLERDGLLRRAEREPTARLARLPRRSRPAPSAVEALLQERAEGR